SRAGRPRSLTGRQVHVPAEVSTGTDIGGPKGLQPGLDPFTRSFSSAAHGPSMAAIGSNRTSTLYLCAVSPSPSARRRTSGASDSRPAFVVEMTLVRFRKSFDERPDAQRGVPPVGRTWDGPAA